MEGKPVKKMETIHASISRFMSLIHRSACGMAWCGIVRTLPSLPSQDISPALGGGGGVVVLSPFISTLIGLHAERFRLWIFPFFSALPVIGIAQEANRKPSDRERKKKTNKKSKRGAKSESEGNPNANMKSYPLRTKRENGKKG